MSWNVRSIENTTVHTASVLNLGSIIICVYPVENTKGYHVLREMGLGTLKKGSLSCIGGTFGVLWTILVYYDSILYMIKWCFRCAACVKMHTSAEVR